MNISGEKKGFGSIRRSVKVNKLDIEQLEE